MEGVDNSRKEGASSSTLNIHAFSPSRTQLSTPSTQSRDSLLLEQRLKYWNRFCYDIHISWYRRSGILLPALCVAFQEALCVKA